MARATQAQGGSVGRFGKKSEGWWREALSQEQAVMSYRGQWVVVVKMTNFSEKAHSLRTNWLFVDDL